MVARASAAALCAFAMASVTLAWAQSPQQVAATAFDSTVTVLAFDSFGQPLGLGSGFVVATGAVITNAHVIAGASSLLVRPIGAQQTLEVSSVLRFDAERDLAHLDVPGLDRPALPVRSTDTPSIGDTIYAVGSPLGLDGTFSQGIVSGYRTEGALSLMQITAPISPGSSGGPILDTRGHLVGVAVGMFSGGQNLNFAIPVATLETFLTHPESRQAVADATTAEQAQAPPTARGADGVVGGAFQFDSLGSYSLSLRNTLPRPVRNIEVLIVFYDRDGFPIDTATIRSRATILAGLGARVTGRVDMSVRRIMTGELHLTELRSPVEIRVLGFEFAD